MALMVDQSSSFKHFCKICKKGFGCGRALGGHMRAHGIGDESCHIDDEETGSDWEDKLDGNISPSNKRMYALRTNPNRLKSCRVCENCGKEFLSWKLFLEHGKCSSEDAESLLSDGEDARIGCGGWTKRKRSMRAEVENFSPNCPSSEEEDLANCLMMLSNATYDPVLTATEESCASASKDEERRNPLNFVAPLAYRAAPVVEKAKVVATKGLFECKACKKVFNSHQALGGHRASHKKVKGCFAARLDQGTADSQTEEEAITQEDFFPTKLTSNFQFEHRPLAGSTSKRKTKIHECSICHRVFSSGQALGGHKRCHWITSNAPDPSSLAKFHHIQGHIEQIQKRPKYVNVPETLDLTLDLNLPASANEHQNGGGQGRRDPSSFGVSTEIRLQTWVGVEAKGNDENRQHNRNEDDQMNTNRIINNNNNNKNTCNVRLVQNNNNNNNSVDDEADSKVKLTKLCELKDTDINGNSSPWLQVGLGSATDVGVVDP